MHKRFVVSVGAQSATDRLREKLKSAGFVKKGDEFKAWVETSLPPLSPSLDKTRGYVGSALVYALEHLADLALWIDPGVEIAGDLEPLWSQVDGQAAVFIKTGKMCVPFPELEGSLNIDCGKISEVSTKIFGVDLRQPAGLRFLIELRTHSASGLLTKVDDSQFAALVSALVDKWKLNSVELSAQPFKEAFVI